MKKLALMVSLLTTSFMASAIWPFDNKKDATLDEVKSNSAVTVIQALPSLAPVLKKVLPAVVQIHSVQSAEQQSPGRSSQDLFSYFFGPDIFSQIKPRGPQKPSISLGSGLIIDEKGLIITNHHVIGDNPKEIKVCFSSNACDISSDYEIAELIGSDPNSDIAVIKLKNAHKHGPLKALTFDQFADSDSVEVGDYVAAVGYPLGLGQSSTIGIISAISQPVIYPSSAKNQQPVSMRFIQTDAAINAGNSGGPLITFDGKLVGLNAVIQTTTQNGGNIGIAFAIPSNMVKYIAQQIIEFGKVIRSQLGITMAPLLEDPLFRKLSKISPEQQGALVNVVFPNSAAEKAGLQSGDIIFKIKFFNHLKKSIKEHEIKNSEDLRRLIGELPVGTEVELGVIRDQQNIWVKTKLLPAVESNTAEAKDKTVLN